MIKYKKFLFFQLAALAGLISFLALQGCIGAISKASAMAKPQGIDFNIAIIPYPQYYIAQTHGGKVAMFRDQITWIKQHHIDSNIVYVASMGDNVDDTGSGEPLEQQWTNVKDNGGFYALENSAPGIPYGLAVGNHDEADTLYHPGDPRFHSRSGLSPVRNTTYRYNKYFDVDYFKDKPWYGGHTNILGKDNNDCHYDKFTVGSQRYMVVYLSYHSENYEDKDDLMLKWAVGVVRANSNAKAILVNHGLLKGTHIEDEKNDYNPQRSRIYDAFKFVPNVFAFLSGHVNEGYREETLKAIASGCI